MPLVVTAILNAGESDFWEGEVWRLKKLEYTDVG